MPNGTKTFIISVRFSQINSVSLHNKATVKNHGTAATEEMPRGDTDF